MVGPSEVATNRVPSPAYPPSYNGSIEYFISLYSNIRLSLSIRTLFSWFFANLLMRYILMLSAVLIYANANQANIDMRHEGGTMEQRILNDLLQDYDMRVRPKATNGSNQGGPVVVTVNILIRMLSKIDVVNMEYSMQMTFREKWVDNRLAYGQRTYDNPPPFLTVPHVKKSLWIPDSFFPTEKSAHRHMIDTENMFLRIYPTGEVLYSVRLSLTSGCSMKLQLYPLDVQYCPFELISYAHTVQDIEYQWQEKEPVQLKKGVGSDLPNFILSEVETNTNCTSNTTTGVYGCLQMKLVLHRQFSYYLVQLYAPTTMIVIVSWVSFWIDMHSTAGRVALGVTTLLTMTTLQSAINAKLPPVSYVKVVDVWLGACQTFVFGALIEYAFVSYQDNVRQAQKSMNAQRIRKAQKRRPKYEFGESDGYEPPCTCHLGERLTLRERLRRYFTKPDYLPAQIDFYARFMAPAGFFVFNIIYWTSCYIMTSGKK